MIVEYVVGTRSRDFTSRLQTPVAEGSLARCVVDEACDRASFYRATASMVDDLVELRSMIGLRFVLDALKRGQSVDAALEQVFGEDARGFAREWEGYVRRRVG